MAQTSRHSAASPSRFDPREIAASIPWRRVMRQVHLWTALTLCIPLVLIGISGSVLVYHHEIIDYLSPPSSYVLATGERRPLEDVVAAALQTAPEGARVSSLSVPDDAGPVRIGVRVAGERPTGPGGGRFISVDPVSLRVFGEETRSAPAWMRQMFQLHANLMIGGREGREVVGWLGVAMMLLGFTGLVLWWPRPGRWLAAFRVSRQARGHRLNKELHHAVGIWGFAVLIVVSFSGVYLCFPQTTGAIVPTVFPGRDLRGTLVSTRVTPVRGQQAMSVVEAVALAETATENARVRSVRIGNRPDQPMRISLAHGGAAPPAPQVSVLVDPWQRRVIEVHDPRSFTLGETITAWQRALHEGSGLGWGWRVAVLISGFLPLLFAVTGIMIWWHKRSGKRKMRAAQAKAEGNI